MNCPICESSDHKLVSTKDGYPIHLCAKCTGMFINPAPSDEDLLAFYTNYHKSKQYKDKMNSKIKRARSRIASLKRRGDLSFLDVGCNLGFATEAGRSLGYRALGIDVDSDAVQRAQLRFPGAEFRAVGVEEVAAEGHKFDIIYSSEVIEHLAKPFEFLRAIHDVMADDGVLFLTTPDIGHFSLPNAVDKLVLWRTFRPPEHLIFFNKHSLKILFKRAGFECVKFRFGFKPTLKVVAKH